MGLRILLGGLTLVGGWLMAADRVDERLEVENIVENARVRGSLLLPRGRLGEIRQRIADDPDARAWWADFRASVESTCVLQAVSVPHGIVQWDHYYSCRSCGTRLKTKSPTLHLCPECGTEHTGWPYDAAARYRVHNRAAVAARDAALAFQLSGNKAYSDAARRILAEYASFYPGLPLHDNSSDGPIRLPDVGRACCGRLFSQALDEARWLIGITLAYDGVAETMSDAERANVETRILQPGADLIRRDCMGIHNHEAWHLSAYGLVALVLGDAQSVDCALNGPFGALEQIRQGVVGDGCWKEGSWGYHFYTIQGLMPFFTSLAHLGYMPPQSYREMFLAPFGQLTPTYSLPAVHDTARLSLARGEMPEFYERAIAWWKDESSAWWMAEVPRTNETYAIWGTKLPSADMLRPPAFVSQNYEGTGFAVMRSRSKGSRGAMPDNYVAVDYGPHGGGHGHPDKLNLLIWAHGRMLAEDFGCISYGNPMHWHWYRSSLAHNTVTCDGVNQQPSTGRCLRFSCEGNRTVAEFDAGDTAFPGVRVTRRIVLDGDRLEDVLTVSSPVEHNWEWAFHARGRLDCGVVTESIPVPPRDPEVIRDFSSHATGHDAWGWTESLREGTACGNWHAVWRDACGQEALTLDQTVTVDGRPADVMRIRTAEVGAQPPPEKAELVACRVRGNAVAFRSVFSFQKECVK